MFLNCVKGEACGLFRGWCWLVGQPQLLVADSFIVSVIIRIQETYITSKLVNLCLHHVNGKSTYGVTTGGEPLMVSVWVVATLDKTKVVIAVAISVAFGF